jgi:hypothetical protein
MSSSFSSQKNFSDAHRETTLRFGKAMFPELALGPGCMILTLVSPCLAFGKVSLPANAKSLFWLCLIAADQFTVPW